MNVAQLVVRALENEGVRYVFGIPGEETLALNAALEDSETITFVPTRHEQGAAFMADVYGRLSSYPGVCMATLGPGATNLITGIADANLDRAPLVAITGQAALDRVYKESHQYVDVVRMFQPVTKWNARIEVPEATPEIVRKAFRVARMEKPGATHIELPEDVADEETDAEPLPIRRTRYAEAGTAATARAAELIKQSARPLLLIGNGVIRRHASGHGTVDVVRDFVRHTRIPAVYTYMAKGAVDPRDEMTVGAVGLLRPGADLAAVPELADADCIIAVGYDLIEWPPVNWNPKRDKTIVHIDSTASEVDSNYIPEVEVVGEIGESLRDVAQLLRPRERLPKGEPGVVEQRPEDDAFPMTTRRVIRDLREAMPDDGIVISDVGAHKVWLARRYPARQPNTAIISNGLASMGISLPGAIAAKLVHPERKVVAFCGDGGFLMNVQELETAKRLGTAVVIVVLVDERYGVIEVNQQRRYGRSMGVAFTNPDFVQLASAFGVPGHCVARTDELLPTLRRALDADTPVIVAVPIDAKENLKLGEAVERVR